MKKLFIGMAIVLGVLGCDQDPIKDFGKGIREAEDPRNKIKEDLSYIPKDAAFVEPINGSRLINFVEGEERYVDFQGRVAFKKNDEGIVKVPFVLKIENLPDNADGTPATFEEKDGRYRFTWTPATNFVKGAYPHRPRELKIILLSTGKQSLREEIGFNLTVHRDVPRPIIVKTENLPSAIFEGRRANFDVIVEDADSEDDGSSLGSELRAPRLILIPVGAPGLDVSHLISMSGKPPTLEGNSLRWKYKLSLDTRFKELTHGRDDFSFGIVAVSQFGIRSMAFEGKIQITNEVTAPEIAWATDRMSVTAGDTLRWEFDVYSPRWAKNDSGRAVFQEDVKIDQFDCSDLGSNSSCGCVNISNGYSRHHCIIKWTPEDADVGDHHASISAFVQNKFYERDIKTATAKRFITVKPRVLVPPTNPNPPGQPGEGGPQ